MLNLSLGFSFLFISFDSSQLRGGLSLFYTPQYQYLKAVSYFLSSHLECQPVFYSEAALPIQLSDLLALIIFFPLFQRDADINRWFTENNVSKCTESAAGLCARLFFFSRAVCRCLKGEDVRVEVFPAALELSIFLERGLLEDKLQCLFIGHSISP